MIRFEWDDKKAEANYLKHGIRFEEAKAAFFDPNRIEEQDRFENGEMRWRTIGMNDNCLLLFIAHTIRENGVETIRIISARRATPQERKRYGNREI
jgi:uncharacterized DUF497 family protein